MTSPSKCSDDKHLYPVRFICQHEDCENSFLCLACFQTHYQDANCSGIYGVHIKEIDGVFEDTYEIITDIAPVVKKESILQEHTMKKAKLLERVQQVFSQEAQIYEENGKMLDEFEDAVMKCLKTRNMKWKQDQISVFRGESESPIANVFSRLEDMKETLETMEFDANDFSNNSQVFKKLNHEIAIEAEELINLTKQEMGSWRLNKERMNDYLEMLCEGIEGMEFSSLFNNEKIEFETSNSDELSEENQILKEEIEMLRSNITQLLAENDTLKGFRSENAELKKQVELLKRNLEARTIKRNELGRKVLQLEEAVQALRDENKSLRRDRDELGKENAILYKENRSLIDERDCLERKLQGLTQEKKSPVEEQHEDVGTVGTGGGLFGDDEDF